MYPSIQKYLENLSVECTSLNTERKLELDKLAHVIREATTKELIFICTHNSRRSHFAQVWMQVTCEYLGLGKRVKTFSGGTEATALNPRTAAALGRAGFQVSASTGENPLYHLGYHANLAPIKAFSKVYSHASNPQSAFIAIMTCDEAAEACPIVNGATKRFNLSYKDPKIADDSAQEKTTYDERCQEIAQEMLYLAQGIK